MISMGFCGFMMVDLRGSDLSLELKKVPQLVFGC